VIKLSTILLAIILTCWGSTANALIDVPTFRMGIGLSPLTFQAGTAFKSASLGETALINPMFLWDVPNLRARVGIQFLADVGTKYGAIATAGVGLTAMFYPLGLSSSREVRDDFSEVTKTKVSPYLQFAITPTKFSATQQFHPGDPLYNTPDQWPYFSSTLIEISVGIGVDYPLSRDFILFGGLHYRTASAQSAESGNIGNGQISYSGVALLIGFMTNFY
jgi:hypothetical protein